ncbi:MAG TPA: HAMP domain-containing sensor histidine kinase [Gemmatimonadales bacterium]|nr:HAMP domain-containing sensor histidine kinase [Gemmatimonadales bacterium]
MGPSALQDRHREILRQAGVALQGRVVTLWEVSKGIEVIPVLASVPDPPYETAILDLDATLRRWGTPIIPGSRWVGSRLGERWWVAPVRTEPAAPPPDGVERRSRERITLELAGLCLGLIDAGPGAAHRRLPPAEALWELARQPSVIAHEVGNPLAVALGNLDLSTDTVRSVASLEPAVRAELLQDLANAAAGIEQASDYLRAIQERPFGAAGRLARFDAVPVLRSAVTLERPLARKRGVELEWNTSVHAAYLFGDHGALYQVATNLIVNAIEATPGPGKRVTVSLEDVRDTLRLTVRDQGRGIPPEHLERVFETGFTTKPTGESHGMGLTVVREVTHKMFGGTVQVESVVGQGTTFTVTLPIPPQRRSKAPSADGGRDERLR